MKLHRLHYLFFLAFGILMHGCTSPTPPNTAVSPPTSIPDTPAVAVVPAASCTQPFAHNIKMRDYFQTIDSIVELYCRTASYDLTEHILINANPRIIDTLASFDYYLRMQDSIFIYNQQDLVVFHAGDSLLIPDATLSNIISQQLAHTTIDVNIPEYRLRILEGSDTLYSFLVRVGRNEKKYLETASHIVNLTTRSGQGQIVRIARDPWFVNPATGKRYKGTTRDDGRYTTMPLIPWIEPTINGQRYGQLIHPTTNQNTLGKAYSHGCIGLSESDMWRVYYRAPIGTHVNFRYDLKIPTPNGDTILLDDIYTLKK